MKGFLQKNPTGHDNRNDCLLQWIGKRHMLALLADLNFGASLLSVDKCIFIYIYIYIYI